MTTPNTLTRRTVIRTNTEALTEHNLRSAILGFSLRANDLRELNVMRIRTATATPNDVLVQYLWWFDNADSRPTWQHLLFAENALLLDPGNVAKAETPTQILRSIAIDAVRRDVFFTDIHTRLSNFLPEVDRRVTEASSQLKLEISQSQPDLVALINARAPTEFHRRQFNDLNNNFLRLQSRLNDLIIALSDDIEEDSLTTRSVPEDLRVIPVDIVRGNLSRITGNRSVASRPHIAPPPSGRQVHIEILPPLVHSPTYYLNTGPTRLGNQQIVTVTTLDNATVSVDIRDYANVTHVVRSYVFPNKNRLIISVFHFVTTSEWPENEPVLKYEYSDFTRAFSPTYLKNKLTAQLK